MKKKSFLFPYTMDNIHPGFSIDCVILCFYKKKIRVLLSKFEVGEYWQLPGGFMFKNESSDDAAKRILMTRVGLVGIYLKQFHLFSNPHRTNRKQNTEYLVRDSLEGGFTEEEQKWVTQRFVSLGYYAFVKYENVELPKVEKSVSKWFDIENLPSLYSDHEHIIKTSLDTIRSMLPIIPVGYELLPEKFAISELRNIYEIILGRALDRRNFQRKVLSTGAVVQLDEVKSSSSYNPPILYSFDKGEMDQIEYPFF